jgi:hypothetical protein
VKTAFHAWVGRTSHRCRVVLGRVQVAVHLRATGSSSECKGDVTHQQGELPSCEVSPARLCNRDRTDDKRIPTDGRLWRVLFTLLGSAAHDLDALRLASTDGHVGCPDRHGRRGSVHPRVGPPAGLRTSAFEALNLRSPRRVARPGSSGDPVATATYPPVRRSTGSPTPAVPPGIHVVRSRASRAPSQDHPPVADRSEPHPGLGIFHVDDGLQSIEHVTRLRRPAFARPWTRSPSL